MPADDSCGFLYFVKGLPCVPSLAELKTLGLSYALESRHAVMLPAGPHNHAGLLVVDQRRVPTHAAKYRPEIQTWQPHGDIPDVWVGMYHDLPPSEGRLRRDDFLPGRSVLMEHGEEWVVPVAVEWSEVQGDKLAKSCKLPRGMAYENGHWSVGDIVPRYRKLWAAAMEYQSAFENAEIVGSDLRLDITQDQCDAFAVLALQTNYHVSATEISLLGAYSEASRERMARVVLDHDTFELLAKKKLAALTSGTSAPDFGTSLCGPAASMRATTAVATDPLLPTGEPTRSVHTDRTSSASPTNANP